MPELTLEKIAEMEKLLKDLPDAPWNFIHGNDHWELYGSCYTYMVQDDSGVPPDPQFIEYVLKSREMMPVLLRMAMYYLKNVDIKKISY